MKHTLRIYLLISFLTSCVSIPKDTHLVSNSICDEMQRMHNLNIALVNQLIDIKIRELDNFIYNEYAPEFISTGLKAAPKDASKEDFFKMGAEGTLHIIRKRNDMVKALEAERDKICLKLNTDYNLYKDACAKLSGFILSAEKVKESQEELAKRASEITKQQIDFSKLDAVLSDFIDQGVKGEDNLKQLTDNIDKLLNK